MVRIWVASDLHAEQVRSQDCFNVQPIYDVLVLAGDTHHADQTIGYARRISPNLPIIVVAGNHEHYGRRHSIHRGIEIMREQAVNDRATGLETWFLENEAVILSVAGQHIRFIGATLWMDFALYGNQPQGIADSLIGLADFAEITGNSNGCKITPENVIAWHRQSRKFIEHELKKPFSGPTVVVTHHLPSRRSVSEKYMFSPLSVGFASKCDDLLGLGADLWVHGHTHDSCDYIFGTTRIVCNPHGYMRGGHPENPFFDPNLCITI